MKPVIVGESDPGAKESEQRWKLEAWGVRLEAWGERGTSVPCALRLGPTQVSSLWFLASSP